MCLQQCHYLHCLAGYSLLVLATVIVSLSFVIPPVKFLEPIKRYHSLKGEGCLACSHCTVRYG